MGTAPRGSKQMDILSKDLPRMFFRKAIRMDNSQFSLDSDMIRLLMAINENKDMAQIATEIGMNFATLRENLSKLQDLGIVESVHKAVVVLDKGFVESLKVRLSHEIGPMAEMLIEDVTAEMGFSASEIPLHRAEELINNLAQEIPEEKQRDHFQKSMIEIIPK
jgi:DNA-binding transcriptional regulator YhcF (GntR family)